MALPLQGLRVVALEQAVAAPFCSRNLADLGADVVKIEPPGGDFARAYDTAARGLSAYFVWLNRGKRSLVLDLKKQAAREVLRALLLKADIFVSNLAPGGPERLGFDYESLRKENPGLIWCRISGYGLDGPYRDRKGYDLLLQGEAGIISITGTPESPAKVGFSIADACSGFYAFSSILLALRVRDQTGEGRAIDVSILEALAEWVQPQAYYAMYRGVNLPRTGMRHNIIVPYGPYRAGDGKSVNLAVQNDRQWRHLCEIVLERPDLPADPRFTTPEGRLINREALEPAIEEALSRFTSDEVVQRLERADVPFGRLNEMTDLASHPALVGRDRLRDVETPVGTLQAFLPPFNLSGIEPEVGPVPTLGQHNAEVLRELGYADEQIETMRAEGAIAEEGN
ncbi:MAG: CoA transferase [Chloroflexi bacterium]|nr:CoA transferase [Chloroflexota bacterium]